MMPSHYMPRYLDTPLRLMIWSIDEFLLLMVPFLLLIFVADAPVMAVIVSAVLSFLIKKVKANHHYHYIFRLVYWYFPNLVMLKAAPPSYQREFLG